MKKLSPCSAFSMAISSLNDAPAQKVLSPRTGDDDPCVLIIPGAVDLMGDGFQHDAGQRVALRMRKIR